VRSKHWAIRFWGAFAHNALGAPGSMGLMGTRLLLQNNRRFIDMSAKNAAVSEIGANFKSLALYIGGVQANVRTNSANFNEA
jgi:hypothetical protein